LGIRQIKDNVSHVSLSESGKFDTSGVLGITRHPLYLATIFLIWARQIDFQSLITNVILTTYLIIGTFLEERKLLLEFGETYREYQDKVSMFVPFKWIKSKYNS